jgi:RNA polymerase-binding transcription factor DksA
MDWKKVAELRKKVLAEEEDLVQRTTENQEVLKRVGPPVHHPGNPSGVRDLGEEQERAMNDKYGWNPTEAKLRPGPSTTCKKCGKWIDSSVGRRFGICGACAKEIMEAKTK